MRIAISVPKPLLLALKLVVTPLAIWLIWRRIDAPRLGAQLSAAKPLWLCACVLAMFLISILNAARWRRLIPVPGVPLYKYLYYVLVGNFLNLFLPSAALAESARTYAFGKKYGALQKNFVGMVIARGSGFAV